MARAKAGEQPRGRSKPNAVEELTRGIDKLRELNAQIEDLSREGFPYRDAVRARTELSLRETIRRAFGEKSSEYQAHKTHKLRTGTRAEAALSIALVKELIFKLESQKAELLGLKPPAPAAPPPPERPALSVVPPLTAATVTPAVAVAPASASPVPSPIAPVTLSVAMTTNLSTPPTPSPSVVIPAPNPPTGTVPPVVPPPMESLWHRSATPTASTHPARVDTQPPTRAMPTPAPMESSPAQPAPIVASPTTRSAPAIDRTGPTPPGQQPSSPLAAAFGETLSPAPRTPAAAPIPGPEPQPPPIATSVASAERNEVLPTPSHSTVPPAPSISAASPADRILAAKALVEERPADQGRGTASPSVDPPAGTVPPAPPSALDASVVLPQAGPESKSQLQTDRASVMNERPLIPTAPAATRAAPLSEEESHDLLRRLCARFHLVARQLRLRKEYRPTLEIEDEFDLQDLFYALLRLQFDEVGVEEWSPAYANGTRRTSYLLDREKTIIVVKKTRSGLGPRDLAEQLKADQAHFSGRGEGRTLFCFIYDPEGRVGNRRGLESDLTSVSDNLTVQPIVAPK